MNRTGIQTVKPGRPESLGRDPPTKLSSPTVQSSLSTTNSEKKKDGLKDLYVSFKVVKSYKIVMNWLYETFSSTAWIIYYWSYMK